MDVCVYVCVRSDIRIHLSISMCHFYDMCVRVHVYVCITCIST